MSVRFSTRKAHVGHTTTVNAPRKATVAAGVSTNAKDCVTYPKAVKQPQINASLRKFGANLNKTGKRATPANTKRADVDAAAGGFLAAARGAPPRGGPSTGARARERPRDRAQRVCGCGDGIVIRS